MESLGVYCLLWKKQLQRLFYVGCVMPLFRKDELFGLETVRREEVYTAGNLNVGLVIQGGRFRVGHIRTVLGIGMDRRVRRKDLMGKLQGEGWRLRDKHLTKGKR